MKRVVELEIQLENVQHGAVSSTTSNESHSVDSKDMAGLKIRIKSLERELQMHTGRWGKGIRLYPDQARRKGKEDIGAYARRLLGKSSGKV